MNISQEEINGLKKAVYMKTMLALKGGEGSGNFGHAGRPGLVGGSSATSYNGGKPYLRYGSENSPMSDWGHAMFADYREGYFDGAGRLNQYQFIPDPNDPRVVRSEILEDKILSTLQDWRENGIPPQYQYTHLENLINDESFDLQEIANGVSPSNIVDSAGIFDSEDFNSFLWNEILEPNGWYAVITPDGAVVYDESMITRINAG